MDIFLMVSASRPDKTPIENLARLTALRAWLDEIGLETFPAMGAWEGAREDSLMVRPTCTLGADTVARYAHHEFQQDSILAVDLCMNGYTVTADGRREYVGRWTQIVQSDTASYRGWTSIGFQFHTCIPAGNPPPPSARGAK